MGCYIKNMLPVFIAVPVCRYDPADLELTLGQCSGLVKDDRINPRYKFKIVGTLDKDTLP